MPVPLICAYMAHIYSCRSSDGVQTQEVGLFLFTTTQINSAGLKKKKKKTLPTLRPLIHIFPFQSCLAGKKKTKKKRDKVTLSHVHFPRPSSSSSSSSSSWRPLIDFDFINSSAKCCVNALADQSHASLTFNSRILLTAWSGGRPFRPLSLICPTHSSGTSVFG